MENILVFGAAGHGKVVMDIIEKAGKYRISGLIDENIPVGNKVLGYEVLGKEEDLPVIIKKESVSGIIVAVGDNVIRSKIVSRIEENCPGLPFINAIHPRAYIAKGVKIADGVVVMVDVYLSADSVIGRHCIASANSVFGHDSVMEEFSSFMTCVTVGGGARIGAYASLNIGSVVVNNATVGEHSIIAAGAVVVKDIPPFSLAMGLPARVVRTREPGEKYL